MSSPLQTPLRKSFAVVFSFWRFLCRCSLGWALACGRQWGEVQRRQRPKGTEWTEIPKGLPNGSMDQGPSPTAGPFRPPPPPQGRRGGPQKVRCGAPARPLPPPHPHGPSPHQFHLQRRLHSYGLHRFLISLHVRLAIECAAGLLRCSLSSRVWARGRGFMVQALAPGRASLRSEGINGLVAMSVWGLRRPRSARPFIAHCLHCLHPVYSGPLICSSLFPSLNALG